MEKETLACILFLGSCCFIVLVVALLYLWRLNTGKKALLNRCKNMKTDKDVVFTVSKIRYSFKEAQVFGTLQMNDVITFVKFYVPDPLISGDFELTSVRTTIYVYDKQTHIGYELRKVAE